MTTQQYLDFVIFPLANLILWGVALLGVISLIAAIVHEKTMTRQWDRVSIMFLVISIMVIYGMGSHVGYWFFVYTGLREVDPVRWLRPINFLIATYISAYTFNSSVATFVKMHAVRRKVENLKRESEDYAE